MRTPASISRHPIHPMLIVFPIGLWIFSLACDLIRLAGAPGDAWITVALYSMVGGLIGALCAAVPGLMDLLYYKGGTPPVKKIALTHMTINLIVVALYAINIWLRSSTLGIKDASRAQSALWRTRTCDGRDRERHGGARWHHPLWRDVSDLL